MDYAATLSAAEAKSLSDPDKPFDDATRALAHLRPLEEWEFQTNIRLKNTLDACEHAAQKEPSWSVLALLVHCEYAIWRTNAMALPMRHHPFLSHWVEALGRLENARETDRLAVNGHVQKNAITSDVVAVVRVEWIKSMLLGWELKGSELGALTPRKLHDMVFRLKMNQLFQIQPYIRMLVEEGVYDKSLVCARWLETSEPEGSAQPSLKEKQAKKPERVHGKARGDWKDTILEMLAKQPDVAVQELARLPLQLPHLDFLTNLLGDNTLEEYSIERAPVITSYIQHSLRTIEMMEAPPSTNGHDMAIVDGAADHTAQTNGIWEYGKDAQSRCVKLLLLFIKSLIRNGLLGADVLYFEIQEICVRYVWIKEVRDFRGWVEGIGDEEDD